jgi:hypothetical protein
MNVNDIYEIAISTIFIGGLLENIILANPDEDVLDIINPETNFLNMIARQILEIRGVSANLFLLNQNRLSGGKNHDLDNKKLFDKFAEEYKKLSDEQKTKIDIARRKIREIFFNKTGGKKRKTKKNKRSFA